MSKFLKDSLEDAGPDVVDAATTVGNKIAKEAEDAVDYVKDKTGMNSPADGTNTGFAAKNI